MNNSLDQLEIRSIRNLSHQKLASRLGSLLIILSLASTIYIYYPVMLQELSYRLHPQPVNPAPISANFSITIPKLGISQQVIPNVNPTNKAEYLQALEHGVAHASGSALPDQPGNIYLFAHSSDNPFSITRYNTAFYLLPKLEIGDQIHLYYHGQDYLYTVRDKQIVTPWQLSSVITNDHTGLTLQTCYPIGTDWRRLLIFADPATQ